MTTTKIDRVIAMDDADVGAGAVTWWRLTGLDHAKFCEALTAAGLQPSLHPAATDDVTALKRALDRCVGAGRAMRLRIEALSAQLAAAALTASAQADGVQP